MNKAIFLDRDGTIIKDKHYLCDPAGIEFYDDAFEALRLMSAKGYRLFLVTNQSGIGRGMFSEEQMHQVHQELERLLAQQNISLTDIAFCPHSPDEHCSCRKPHPKMILDLMQKHQISTSSYMIGDKDIDAQAGINAQIHGVVIGQSQHYASFPSLLEFARSLKQ